MTKIQNSNDWKQIYTLNKDILDISGIIDLDSIIGTYIYNNFSNIIVEQYEQYKEIGKYNSSAEFVKNEISPKYKNSASFYNDVKNGKRKYTAELGKILKEFPIVQSKEDELALGRNRFDIIHALELGAICTKDYKDYSTYLYKVLKEVGNRKHVIASEYFKDLSKELLNKSEDNDNKDSSKESQNKNKNNDDKDSSKEPQNKSKANDDKNSIQVSVANLTIFRNYLNIQNLIPDDYKTNSNKIWELNEIALNTYISNNFSEIIRAQRKVYKDTSAKKITVQDFMKEFLPSYSYLEGKRRDGYYYLINKCKSLDPCLLKDIKKFSILKDENSYIFCELAKVRQLYLALNFAILVLELPSYIPIIYISSAIIDANLSYKGDNNYLEHLSKYFYKHALQLEEEDEQLRKILRE